MYGFPSIDLLKHVQVLEASCWSTAHYRAQAPSNVTSNGPQLTRLRMLESSRADARHIPAYQTVSRLTNLQTLMITTQSPAENLGNRFSWMLTCFGSCWSRCRSCQHCSCVAWQSEHSRLASPLCTCRLCHWLTIGSLSCLQDPILHPSEFWISD